MTDRRMKPPDPVTAIAPADARNRPIVAVLKTRVMWRGLSLLAMGFVAGSCFLQGPPPPRPERSLETLPPPTATMGRGPTRGVVVAGAPAAPSAPRGLTTEPVVSVAPPDAGGTYRYNARFEPPRGRIIHGMGQWEDGNAEYLRMLDDPLISPVTELVFVPVGDWPRPWEGRAEKFRVQLETDKAAGRFPHVDISLVGIDPATRRQVGIDHEIAGSDRYDDRLRDLARVLRDVRGPVFLRIGGEFSGSWKDYHVYDYPRAYRKIVEMFRAEGADNVAFVWCYEPSAPDDFDVKDADGWRWFPGDDVIDWYGIDVYDTEEFVLDGNTGRRGVDDKAARAARFLKMAHDHGKPVIVECSASRVSITPDLEDGRRDWQHWFVPFLRFLDDNPGIEAFHYVNFDWRKSSSADTNGWLDARMNLNTYISQKWIAEMRKPKYLHAPEIALLNGFSEASAPLPAAKATASPKVAAPAAPSSGGR